MIEFLDANLRAWAAGLGWPMEALLRLVLAALAGGLIGLEREVRGRQAGFRTNMLVCLGSALVMLVSTQFASYPWHGMPGVSINVDPARIAYGVMGGVGFLGAGTIIHNRGEVRGLTTAAGLWCVAALGLSLGFGLYLLSAMTVILVLLALWLLDYLEELLPRRKYRRIVVRIAYHPGCISSTIERLHAMGIEVMENEFERHGDLSHADITLKVSYIGRGRYNALLRQFESDPEYQLVASQEL